MPAFANPLVHLAIWCVLAVVGNIPCENRPVEKSRKTKPQKRSDSILKRSEVGNRQQTPHFRRGASLDCLPSSLAVNETHSPALRQGKGVGGWQVEDRSLVCFALPSLSFLSLGRAQVSSESPPKIPLFALHILVGGHSCRQFVSFCHLSMIAMCIYERWPVV